MHLPQQKCRAYGINAWELTAKNGIGLSALAYAKSLLPIGTAVKVISHGWDKYGGRFNGEIEMPDGRDFSTVMLEAGFAVKYPSNK